MSLSCRTEFASVRELCRDRVCHWPPKFQCVLLCWLSRAPGLVHLGHLHVFGWSPGVHCNRVFLLNMGPQTLRVLILTVLAVGLPVALAAPSLTAQSELYVSVGATELFVVGADFEDGGTTLSLSASSGSVSQPTNVRVVSTTALIATVPALGSGLDGATISAVVTTSAGSSSSTDIAVVTTGAYVFVCL